MFTYLSIGAVVFLAIFIYFEYSIDWLYLAISLLSQLIIPCLFFYILSLLKPDFKMSKGYFLLFIPLMVSILYMLVEFFLFPGEMVENASLPDLSAVSFYYIIVFIVEILFEVAVVIILFIKLEEYKKRLKQSYADIQGIDYPWITILLWANLISIFIIDILGFFINMIFPGNDEILFKIPMGIMALLAIATGFLGLRNTRIFVVQPLLEIEEEDKKKAKYEKSRLTESQIENIKNLLSDKIYKDKMYLNPKLSLPEVAQVTKLKVYIISEVLNNCMKTSFFDYVNDLRVEEAKKRLIDGTLETQTILAIALDSGFNSKSSFNRIFKMKTGFTPTQFAKKSVLSFRMRRPEN